MIEWGEEELERAFLMMQVLVKNMEFMGNMITAARAGEHQRMDGIVSDFLKFVVPKFKGVNGMKDELVAFARQLGVGMEVHVAVHPPQGPPN